MVFILRRWAFRLRRFLRAVPGVFRSVRHMIALIGTVGLGYIAIIHGVHLPKRDCRPPLPNAVEARRAIFAARMAFSSFVIRSMLK